VIEIVARLNPRLGHVRGRFAHAHAKIKPKIEKVNLEKEVDHAITKTDHGTERIDHVKEKANHLIERKDHMKGKANHLIERKDHVKEKANHVTERRDHVKEKANHLIERKDHVNEKANHVTEWRDHVKGKANHVTERKDHVKGKANHATERRGHVKGKADRVTEKVNLEKGRADHVTGKVKNVIVKVHRVIVAGLAKEKLLGNEVVVLLNKVEVVLEKDAVLGVKRVADHVIEDVLIGVVVVVLKVKNVDQTNDGEETVQTQILTKQQTMIIRS